MTTGLAAIGLAGRRVFGILSLLDIVVPIIRSRLSRALAGGAPLVGTMVA